MFKVVLYESKTGYSELANQLAYLKQRSHSEKDARIQLGQIKLCVSLLEINGTRMPLDIVKHIIGDIWELRPGKNRILFFYFKQNKEFVLLHMFVKKTQKTPKQEIKKAINEMNDYVSRKDANI